MVDNKFFVIDSHCHIYPEKIASKAVEHTDNFYGVKSNEKGTVSELLKCNDDCGIDISIVQSVATTPKQVASINRFISEEVKKSNGRLVGLGTLHPNSDNIGEDIEYIKQLGLKGVKLHPDIQGFKIDDYRCLKIYELCENENLPILMHTGDNRYDNSNPNRLLPILEIYTELTVIGAHFGGYSIWDEASKLLSGHKNLFVDCSSSFFKLSDQEILTIIRRYGVDRVLFGTDFPMWSPKKELERFLSLDLNNKEKEQILSLNAKKVFGI